MKMLVGGEDGGFGAKGAHGDQQIGRGKDDALAIKRPSHLSGAFPNRSARADEGHDREILAETSEDIGVAPAAAYLQDDHAARREIPLFCMRRQLDERVEPGARAVDVVITVGQDEVHRSRGLACSRQP